LIRPLPLSGRGVADILVLLAVTIFLFVSLFVLGKHKISRIEGHSMIGLYAAYLGFIILREM
jgi:Ca2+/Na+ antiporter